MLEVQKLGKKNFLSDILPEKKSDNLISFTPEEWKYFYEEIKLQIESQELLNLEKASNNAKYLARLDRAFANVEEGHWTEHDLIEVDDNE